MIEAEDHKRVSAEGRAIGEQTAKLSDRAIAILVAEGETDDRCKSCAFRLGTVPNGCIQTQMDVMKAVIEDVPFLCHQADRKGFPCHGWYAARVQLNRVERIKGKFEVEKCPWEFSPPDEIGG
jgi:hypothetical protein